MRNLFSQVRLERKTVKKLNGWDTECYNEGDKNAVTLSDCYNDYIAKEMPCKVPWIQGEKVIGYEEPRIQ